MGTNYHNEVLRLSRVLERKRLAAAYFEESPEDRQVAAKVLQEIKGKHGGIGTDLAYDKEPRNAGDNLTGVGRIRQSYDHSRNGPTRDDSKRMMRHEATMMYGRKPNYMTNVWKA